MKGILSIFDHKKWIFSYVIVGLSFWQLEPTGIVQIISILIPVTLGASSFEKSKMIKD